MTTSTANSTFLHESKAALPIFAASEVAWNKQQYRQAARTGAYFVRPAAMMSEVAARFPLRTILERTEQELATVSRYTGALVVPHVWGVIEPPADEAILDRKPSATYQHADLPEGLLLAARVETIHQMQASYNSAALQVLLTGIRRYRQAGSPDNSARQRLIDVDQIRQYSTGQTCSMAAAGLILHDIEPLITLD